jgi:hypothetical protein
MEIILALNRVANEQKASRHQEHTYEYKKGRRECLTIIGVFSAAVVGLATLIFAHRDTMHALKEARYAASIQHADTTNAIALATEANKNTRDAASVQHTDTRDSLIAANRPWLKVKEEIASDLTFDKEGASITLRINVHNTGHSPATEAMAIAEFVPCVNYPQTSINMFTMSCDLIQGMYKRELDRFCRELSVPLEESKALRLKQTDSDLSLLLFGNAVFPDDDKPIEARATYGIPDPPPQTPTSNGTLPYGYLSLNAQTMMGFMPTRPTTTGPTMVLTCVLYGSNVEGRFYRSAHAFYLERISGEREIDLSTKVPIPHDQLVLTPAGFGVDYVE